MQHGGPDAHLHAGKVHLCHNGSVGLSFGPTVIHLSPVAFRDLLIAMQKAAKHLGLDLEPAEEPVAAPAPGWIVPFRRRK